MAGKSPKGLIFNCVQGSFVDGYGIRTTIFLKGCPLRCKWCCNPEGQSFHAQLRVMADRCNGCGSCMADCPHGAIAMEGNVLKVDRSRCDGCGECLQHCYTNALDLFGVWWSAEDMFQHVRKDKCFFDASGGGLTIGGGEAICYPEFVLALMDLCQKDAIHVAVDTCGYTDSELGKQVLRQADLLLFDIKGIDPACHQQGTGVSNEQIWENLRMRNALGKPVIIRLPIIPGYTDSDQTLVATAEALAKLNCVARVDILPYHQLGLVKYQQLGMKYQMDGVEPISELRQQEIKELFEFYGFKAQIGG